MKPEQPWRLKILHPHRAEFVLERQGRTVKIDPWDPPTEDDIVVLTGPMRTQGTVAALAAGVPLTVVAPEPVFDWLAGLGRVTGGGVPREIDGVTFEATPWPAPAVGIGTRLRGALNRLRDRPRAPACEPWIVEIRVAGLRLLHLDLSLNHATTDAWVTRAAARFGNADLTLLGLPYGEGAALCTWLPRFGPNKVLLAEMTNDDRRELGLPTELVTPTRDQLVTLGMEVHVFATQTSLRFE